MDSALFLEISAVILALFYLYFLIQEKIVCWFFGIASSLLSIVLFYQTGLYSESLLYLYYVVIGIYGYFLWRRSSHGDKPLSIRRIAKTTYLILILAGSLLTALLGYYFKTYADATVPYIDAGTTIFSFIASYLEANKYLDAWLFWIVVNIATLVLYLHLDLFVYSGLTFGYIVFSVVGFLQWRKKIGENAYVPEFE
ncbi:MAG: nicotinamide mononucleotide transporter [Cyclobacteriaceae bacterium]|jgi:nicotinamide mononucleotide transporter